MDEQRLALLCDFYELTMTGGFFKNGFYKKTAYFDVFFRSVPDSGGFAVCAGLQQVIGYIEKLRFGEEDINFLRSKGFDEDFLDYLKSFRFTGDIYAVPEGTPVFPCEPILTVKAPLAEALLIETHTLLTLNHQSLIATKTSRIVRAAAGRAVLEFGSRRAQGGDGAVIGARAAYIGGAAGTSCTMANMLYGVPLAGTMSHAWVQMFDSEYEAFKAFCEIYPRASALLTDTYDTLKSGVPNAIRAFKKVLVPRGITDFAIRLDSGDIACLSKKAREMLDKSGLRQCKIIASNSLDEHSIQKLISCGAKVDIFAVGERLITAKSDPVFGGVYKLAAAEDENGEIYPKIKVSENAGKITNPHFKKLYRFYCKESGKALADELCIYNEKAPGESPRKIFDPARPQNTAVLKNYTVRELQKTIFKNGELVYQSPSLKEIAGYSRRELNTLRDGVKRLRRPAGYCVGLSEKLYKTKERLLKEAKATEETKPNSPYEL